MDDLQIGLITNVVVCHLSLFRRKRGLYGLGKSCKQNQEGLRLRVDSQKRTDSLDVNAEAGHLLTVK